MNNDTVQGDLDNFYKLLKETPLEMRLQIAFSMSDYANWKDGEYNGDWNLIEKYIKDSIRVHEEFAKDREELKGEGEKAPIKTAELLDEQLLKDTINDFRFWFNALENRSDAPSIEQWLQLLFEGINQLSQTKRQATEQGGAWISVKDRLPELKKHVWKEEYETFTNEITTTVIVYDAVEDVVFHETYSESRGFNENPDVTHWMPLPLPPSQTKGKELKEDAVEFAEWMARNNYRALLDTTERYAQFCGTTCCSEYFTTQELYNLLSIQSSECTWLYFKSG